MPLNVNTNENENNIKFIEKFFNKEDFGDVVKKYPDCNYRVRMAELTNFWPYYSEAPKHSSENQTQYEDRVNTSGRLFGSEHIVLNDIVHHNEDISGMVAYHEYTEDVPEVLFYIEKCSLLKNGEEYHVESKNLNDKNFIANIPPQVSFPIDLSQDDKGYYCYRKTLAVQKNNNLLMGTETGWEKVAEFSNNDIKNYIAGANLDEDVKSNPGFSFYDSGVSGYSGWTNEVLTSYKVLDSGSVENVSSDIFYLRKSRTVNYISDPSKTYTLERKVSRASNNSTTNPPAWELMSPQARFPYVDTEVLSDNVRGSVGFDVNGVYEVVQPAGDYAENNLDYFQVDLIEDWGKSKEKNYTFKQDSKELTFESGEALRVVQKANSYYSVGPFQEVHHDIMGLIETSFSPNSTGVSGSISGVDNAENFYRLEYQLIPKKRESKKLYYETGIFDGISVGDRVFFNSGIEGEEYSPIQTNIFGDSVDELDSRSPIIEETSQHTKEEDIGLSYPSGMFHTIEPEEALSSESDGVGWSYFSSGEKYLVVPKGGYNGLDMSPKEGDGDASLLSYSAGEVRSTFYQGHQTWGDEETQYALTEYRSFDPTDVTENPYVYNKEKEIRINEQALCLGESATELPDIKNPDRVPILDFEYGSEQIFRNASILNIDSTDGSIDVSNLKSNKEEFERKPNLFFEKQYIGSLTILATGQKQDHDISTLKEIISTELASDASVFYLERDIYVDSDVTTQANFSSPTVFSTGLGGAADPFILSENSSNPLARGEEKLYLTETYHETPKEYPFTDESYFIKRPTVTERFEYVNSKGYEEKNFSLTNIESASTYSPDYFYCSLNYVELDAMRDIDGYGLLSYRGVSLTGSASVTDITMAGATEGERGITFDPQNTGVYYEAQARYTNVSYNWTDVSPALDIHADTSFPVKLRNDMFTTSNDSLEIRVLEWDKSSIMTRTRPSNRLGFEGDDTGLTLRVSNESPDSLILRSEYNGVFYDWSKMEHNVTKEGSVPTVSDSNIFSFRVPSITESSGTASATTSVSVSSIAEDSGVATATTSASHFFETGDTVIITGATPTTYNASYVVTKTGNTTFTFFVVDGTGNANGTILAGMAHSLKTGDTVTITGATPSVYNASFEVTVTGSTTFTFSITNNTGDASGTIVAGLDIYVMNLSSAANNDDYLSFATHRSFDVQSGDFSMEFWVNSSGHLAGYNNYILHRAGSFTAALKDNGDLEFKIGGYTLSSSLTQDVWKHVVISAISDKRSGELNLSLFIDGELKDSFSKPADESDPKSVLFGELSAVGNGELIIGQGFEGKLYGIRIYIGKSNYNKTVSVPLAPFGKEAEPKAYKILKYVSTREVSLQCDWMINKNIFNNVSPPSSYKEITDSAQLSFMSEWTKASSTTDKMGDGYTRALINYINNYAYNAPHNPHINKNYEGTPIEKPSDLDPKKGKIVYDNYKYVDGNKSTSNQKTKKEQAAPYLYEYVGEENKKGNLDLIRLHHKGGFDVPLEDKAGSGAFLEGSRLRITKYVYKLYTKRAVVVADVGYKNSRSHQLGWAYQLQYSTDNGAAWVDVDSDVASQAQDIFYNNEYSVDLSPNAFGNISSFNSLSVVILKSDITKNHKIDAIQFRIRKEQNIDLGNSSNTGKVLKKLNFLPLEVDIPPSGCLLDMTQQAEHSNVVDGANEAEVKLDKNRTYVIIKDSNEEILKSSVSTDKLQINSLSFNEETSVVEDNFTDLPDGEAVEFKGLTGLHITRTELESLEDIKTIIGPKPEGLSLCRVEKSHKGKISDDYIRTGEIANIDYTSKAFITPSITGSYFDELDDFNYFADHPEEDLNAESSLVNFSCLAATTGEDETVTATGVSGVKFAPLNQFYNSPVITSDVTVEEEDAGKTFITSGDLTLTNNASDITVASIAGTLNPVGVIPFAAETPIPTATLANYNDIVIIQDSGRVEIDGGHNTQSTGIVNIFTGDNSNIVLNGPSADVTEKSNVVFVEHGKINLTEDDVGETIVVDCASDVILPDGFLDTNEITFLNATQYETKVLSENSSHTIGTNNNKVDYIPKETVRKYKYNNINSNWSASDIDIIKFNQLNLTNVDLPSAGNTIVHNEDVDIRITDKVNGVETIVASTNDKYINIVRNQVNNFDIQSDPTDWITPIIRVYVDGALKHIAPSGSLGVRISKTSEGWKFKKIIPIIGNEVAITPASAGKVFSYSGEEGSISMSFSDGRYWPTFKIFLVSGTEIEEVNLKITSRNESVKFLNRSGEDTDGDFITPMGKNTLISISKESEGLHFVIKEEGQSNEHKFNQPNDSSTRVLINRNENFGLELPTITEEFDHERGFDLVFSNFSESSCSLKIPTLNDGPNIPSFKSRNYKYINPSTPSVLYDKFKNTSKIKDSSTNLNDGDFLLLDGSVADPRLRSFAAGPVDLGLQGGDGGEVLTKVHKFSISEGGFLWTNDLYGERASYITFDHNTDQFTLKNHELSTRQRLVFNCEKLFVADHYYDGTDDDFSVAIATSNSINIGQTVLIYNHEEQEHYQYFTWDGSELWWESIEKPESLEGVGDADPDQVLPNDILEADRLYVYIKNDDKIYDFFENKEGLDTEKGVGHRIDFELSVNDKDDTSIAKKQTFFVDVVDDNKFKLYKDKARTQQVTKGNEIALLSDTFYVENISVGSLNVLNLGESENIKNYSEEVDIVSPLGVLEEATIHQHSSSAYTNGDATASGIYLATGWNGTSDTLDIDDLTQQNTVFLSGKFHAKADLSDTEFNNNYYINVGLDETVITNTSGGLSHKIEKNRAYEHTSGGTFEPQDQTSDIIYYPKNELHVPDRKYLGKNSKDQTYNFVFFKPDEHSDDLKIVLPNTWTNLGLGSKKLAVANLHNRQVTVSNFAGTSSFVLNADSVVFMDDASDYTVDNKSLFTGTGADLNNLTITYDENTLEASVKEGSTTEIYYITRPSDIILDHSIHHGKKIFVDGPVNFLRPYLKSKDGITDYGTGEYNNQTSPSLPTSFQIANVSRDPVSVYVNGVSALYTKNDSFMASNSEQNPLFEGDEASLIYSSSFYSVEIDEFQIESTDQYFKHFTLDINSSAAGSFEYPATDLNSAKAYNIFGVELPLKLNVYTSYLDTGDAEKINYIFQLEQDGQIKAGSVHYKVSGIGATDVPRLSIVNSAYEDIRISLVSAKGELVGNAVLESKIKKIFDDMQAPIEDAFKSYTISTEGDISGELSESFTPKLLGKNRALSVSLPQMVDGLNEDYWDCSALNQNINLADEADYTGYALQPDLVKITRRDLKVYRKDTIDASLVDAVFEGTSFSRSITSISDPFDIALPHRRLIGDRDFHFILINASWSSINVVFPEDVGTSFAIPAGETRKVKYNYTDNSKTYSSEETVITDVLNRGLGLTELDVFLASEETTESKPFKIQGEDGKRIETKIINNTGGTLHVQAMGGGDIKTIKENSYTKFRLKSNSLEKDEQDVDVRLTKIRDGGVHVGEPFINEVVLFCSYNDKTGEGISLLNFAKDEFFEVDLVPFINDKEFKRTDGLGRNLGASRIGGYTIMNENKDEEDIYHLRPIEIKIVGGDLTKPLIDVSCYLFEFILDESTNGKTAYPNKNYDYIIKNEATFSCILYNGRVEEDGNTNFYRLNAAKEVLSHPEDEGVFETAYSAKGKLVFKLDQVDTTVTAAKGQVYPDVLDEFSVSERVGGGSKLPGTKGGLTDEEYADQLASKSFLYQRFYLNKDAYNDKIIIFKDPFDIIYSATSGEDYYYSKASATRLVNISKEASCYINSSLGEDGELYSEHYMSALDSEPLAVVRPKYNLTPDANKLYVLRYLADVEQTSINNLKIANVTRGTINIRNDDGGKWKVFSSERADFAAEGSVEYSEVRKQEKRDWFIRLVGLDIPHLIKDNSYFDEKEYAMEASSKRFGRINVDYNGVRFKFSNIFGTNKMDLASISSAGVIVQTGFQSIEDYNDPYKFGVTLLTNRRGIQRKLFWEKDVSDKFFPVYLKLPWDMPKDIIAYMLSTGHERLSRCLHFNERNGEITLGGIESGKSYSLRSEGLSSYDFTHDAEQADYSGPNNDDRLYYDKNYIRSLKAVEFRPALIYNNETYFSGKRMTGGKLSEYKVSYPYFSTLNVSQFSSVSLEESDNEEKEDRKRAKDQLKEGAKNQTFSWNKVTKDSHENHFLSGKVESIDTYDASARHELIQGRKIKDISGTYEKEEDPEEQNKSNWFEFIIPLRAGFNYARADSDNSESPAERVEFRNSAGEVLAGIIVNDEVTLQASEGDTAKITVYFMTDNTKTNVESPGYEHEISASLTYNRSDLKTAGDTQVNVMRISLESADSMPFVADGFMSSLNEDFSSPESDEFISKSLDDLTKRYGGSSVISRSSQTIQERVDAAERSEEFQIKRAALMSYRDNQVYQSLKNNLGYSFFPLFGVTSGQNPMVGFEFNLKKNLRSYRAIKFRLKKLIDRRITFEDVTKDEKIGPYLTINSAEANLQYQLDTSVNTIAYHDIAHPGGVATAPNPEWRDVELSSSDLTLQKCADGDAVIFKEDEGEIKAGKPYFIRVRSVSDSSYLVDVLKIFCSETTYDEELKVNADLTTSNPVQKYKIVNYFNLRGKDGESDHRGSPSVINKLYDDADLAKGSTLRFPIIIGSKKFYLERPLYTNPEGTGDLATWAETIYNGDLIRTNLEMSEIAQTFITIPSTGRTSFAVSEEMQGFVGDEPIDWKDENIFESVKNLLYRFNTQIQMVDWKPIKIEDEDETSIRVNVKLTKGREYRCLFIQEDASTISSVTVNGVEKTSSFCDIFTASTEDLYIQVDGLIGTGSDVFAVGNTEAIKTEIQAYLCVVESAGFVDQTVKDGGNLVVADYIDYQIPMLNSDALPDFGFINPDSFYYTESHENIFSRGQRQENLTNTHKDHGLMYDGPMPASIKYIYPRVQAKNELSFNISNDFWDGFINKFDNEDKYGSMSNRTKPKNINFTLQELIDEGWEDVKDDAGKPLSLTASQKSRSGKTSFARVYVPSDPGVIAGKIYRLKVNKESVAYYEDGKEKTFSNSKMRVPFKWRSTIFATDIPAFANASKGGVLEHNVSLIENPLLQKSISFPEEGISKLGSYSHEKEHPSFGFEVPYTRRYMYRLSHSLNAVYVDKLSHGGISRIVVTDPGSDYRIAPDVTVASPEKGTTATAKAHIESGRLKFIDVMNSGSGYSDLSKLNTTKFISNNRGKGTRIYKEWIIQAAEFTYNFTLNGTKIVTHDGEKNIVSGSYVSGTGITPDTKVTRVISSTKFEISHDATETGVRSLAIDLVERQMPFISLEDQFGVETAEVTLKTIDPSKLDESDPRFDDPCQESFGMDFQESETVAEYMEIDGGQDSADNIISTVTDYVSLIEEAVEGQWDGVDTASIVGDQSAGENSSIEESKNVSIYGVTTDDEYIDAIRGSEDNLGLGIFLENEADEIKQTKISINESLKCDIEITPESCCEKETFPPVGPGAAKAVINNHSLAEYRVVENALANKSNPWLSSFSREENPSLPKGFGINPGSPLTSEVFNSYARAVNNLSLVGAYVPVLARVKKFRQYEYRYIDDMAGLTFLDDNSRNAGEPLEEGGWWGDGRVGDWQEYGSWQTESKVNFIHYRDPTDDKEPFKKAWFSAEFGDSVIYDDENKLNIINSNQWITPDDTSLYKKGLRGFYDDESDAEYGERLKNLKKESASPNWKLNKGDGHLKIKNDNFKPYDIGLPTIVNIPEEVGVHCWPGRKMHQKGNTLGKGIQLPLVNNRRASAYSGELVHKSEAYDITDEEGIDSVINIAGSNIINTSYENELIFGCQVRGKPFWSTFLKTTRHWTEFEILPSPSFIESLSTEKYNEGMGTLTQLKGYVTRYTTLCDNKEFSKVRRNYRGYNHSVCAGGRNDGIDYAYSYEALFNLKEGDSVVGPVENSHEFIHDQTFGGEGVQVFKLEPEFTQALAVYGYHGSVLMGRFGDGTTNMNYWAGGPCIHKCSPSSEAVFQASDEMRVFDLMGDAKFRPLDSTTRMPRLIVFTDPKTGEKSYRYE